MVSGEEIVRPKYSINRKNQLTLKGKVIPGHFELEKNYSLVFKKRGKNSVVTEKVFSGRWSLGAHETLRLQLKDSEEKLILKSSFVSAGAYGLAFSVTTEDPDGAQAVRLFQFGGFWQADKNNRLGFVIQYRDSKREMIVFEGIWKLGHHHEIVYHFESEELKNGKKAVASLILRGAWGFEDKGYLTYLVEGRDDSKLRFRAEYISSKKKNALSFRVGVEGSNARTLQFFGRWKVLSRTELGFEIDYGEGKVETVKFLIRQGDVRVELMNQRKEGLGIQVSLTKQFLGQAGEAFIRARAAGNEQAVEGGVKLKW